MSLVIWFFHKVKYSFVVFSIDLSLLSNIYIRNVVVVKENNRNVVLGVVEGKQ